ncbi:hypothetical protein OKA04_03370 [Luteolibacter flavescens]|uniref:Lipoprotein n=1 Tax=Luteolibacter flavescens TaxID=1859460 RepID=A0ABT3FJK6_9BACT|nr:hypothetical protein [Luteolibacter flavescens]MCW1883753.1 hypothetical protein [Luteolibacter flavescens]
MPLAFAAMNRFCASLIVSAFLNGACQYDTPASYSLPVTPGSSGATESVSNARPTVRFPARVAVARIESSYSGFRMIPETDVEQSDHAAAASALPGVAGLVSLNRVALLSEVKSYRDLDIEARKVGADLVAIYRFETSESSSDAFLPLSIATLGLAPTNGYTVNATATLMVRDARTGYLYGVMEESATNKGLTAGMDLHNAKERSKRNAKKKALDKLTEKLPGFWNGVLVKGR